MVPTQYISFAQSWRPSCRVNSFDDLRRATDFAHRFDTRIYATVNTIVYDSELAEVERMIHQLYRCGIDALIVQDLGITRLDLPPMASMRAHSATSAHPPKHSSCSRSDSHVLCFLVN